MNSPHMRPEDDKVRSAKYVVPIAALLAIAVAVAVGSYVMDTSENQQAINPADRSSATGTSSGESGQSSIEKSATAKSNPGAAAAPEKAPQTESGPATPPQQPKP